MSDVFQLGTTRLEIPKLRLREPTLDKLTKDSFLLFKVCWEVFPIRGLGIFRSQRSVIQQVVTVDWKRGTTCSFWDDDWGTWKRLSEDFHRLGMSHLCVLILGIGFIGNRSHRLTYCTAIACGYAISDVIVTVWKGVPEKRGGTVWLGFVARGEFPLPVIVVVPGFGIFARCVSAASATIMSVSHPANIQRKARTEVGGVHRRHEKLLIHLNSLMRKYLKEVSAVAWKKSANTVVDIRFQSSAFPTRRCNRT